MNKKTYIIISIVFILLLSFGILSSIFQKDYSNDNVNNNLAKIEIYSAVNNELIKTIDNEKTLYDYNNNFSFLEDYEENQNDLKNDVQELKEQYNFITYKFPVTKFGSKELEENFTITLYENSNIIKFTASNESIKSFSLPEQFLTFYYNVSNEELQFFYSLIEE